MTLQSFKLTLKIQYFSLIFLESIALICMARQHFQFKKRYKIEFSIILRRHEYRSADN